MNPYSLVAILLVITAIFALVNQRLLKWPESIGVMSMSVLASTAILLLGLVAPEVVMGPCHLIASADGS